MGAALSLPIDIQLKDQTRPVTVSWGIAAFENTQDDSIRAATKAADVALYDEALTLTALRSRVELL